MNRMFTLVLAGAALTATSAMGAIVTYTDATAFNASTIVGANGISVLENFNTNASIFTTFVAPGAVDALPGFSGGSPDGSTDGQRDTRVARGGYSEVITLNTGNMTAFGATWDLSPGAGLGQFVTITLNYADATPNETLATVLGQTIGDGVTPFFWGFTSTIPIESITLAAGNGFGSGETFSFDDLLIERDGDNIDGGGGDPEPPSGVPEPSTFGLMGIAMVGLGLVRRMRA